MTPSPRLIPLAFVAAAAPALGFQAPRYAATVFAPPAPHAFAAPLDLNSAGLVTLYAADAAFSPLAQAFLLDPAHGYRPFPQPQPYYNYLSGFEQVELVVGRSNQQAFVWERGAPSPLDPAPGFFSGSAADVNASGQIVGSTGDSDFIGPHPCYWSAPDAPGVVLPALLAGAPFGGANAINSAGQIVGTSGEHVSAFYAVRWDTPSSAPLQIGPLPGAFNSQGIDLNERGDVVGTSAYPNNELEAFLYVDSTRTLIPLGHLPGGGYSEARGVNDARQVVGTARALPAVAHAFLWQRGTLHDLNDLLVLAPEELAYLSAAQVINDAGVIAAEAVLKDGRTGVAVLRPLP